MAEYMREYRATPIGRKNCIIANWKFQGLKDDYDKVYDKFINTTNCEKCNVLLEGRSMGQSNVVGNKKCMDHDHATGLFRMVVCSRCNTGQPDRKKSVNNTSGHKGLSYDKKKRIWKYRKALNKKTYQIMNKNKITLLTYKFCYLMLSFKKPILK